ncbi:manganese efflux pump [Paenibacillaceae bacterium]|nr:manganese efflux pump [Paenibacillaceae bacterium]
MIEAGLHTLHTGQLLTIIIMAFALGMDAFSLGIGVGLKGIRRLDIIKLSLVIALFHIAMPLLGIFAGQYMSQLLGNVATLVAGLLLLLLGAHMIYNSFRGGASSSFDYRTAWGMLIFAFSVSIDSFSVGVSLGMFAADLLLTICMFGLFGGVMSAVGLILGRRVSQNLGDYGEACGGVILLAFGVLFLI